MTEKLAIEFMDDMFSIIKAKRHDISEIEKIIKIDFEKNVVFFFKDKGYEFQLVDNKYDPINRYRLNKQSDNFKRGNDYYLPKFKIVPGEFVIKFEWWKTGNQNPTKVYWHPEEMTLETFYNKNLKRAFKLI